MPFSPSSKLDPEMRHAAVRAHNRHVIDFCSHDDRPMGVAIVPLDDPEYALTELDFVLASKLKAVWIAHRPCGDCSPGHVEFDPLWVRLEESGTPFALHLGGSPLQLAKA